MNLDNRLIGVTRRVRITPYTRRVESCGVTSYSVYNHMLLPAGYQSLEDDYWHLCKYVQVWDVAAERQVELKGPDAARLAQLMTPRDLSKIALLQGKYAPVCDEKGRLLNDPIVIKLAEDRFWFSLADSDIKLFAKGLAIGFGLEVDVFEPDVSPLAVQGPLAGDLCARVFGEEVRSIRFFHGKFLPWRGEQVYVARSGWSHQGGFEIYLHRGDMGEMLWDELFAKGADLNVAPGCPHSTERVEAGLLSYGSDMDENDTPFECGLDSYLDLEADIESISLPALRAMAGKQTMRLMGVLFNEEVDTSSTFNLGGACDLFSNGEWIGEVRTQTWSFRYKKYMMMVLFKMDYLAKHDSITIDGKVGQIYKLPFGVEALKSSQGE